MSESFFVLSGTMSLFDGRNWVDSTTGDYLYVPPGGLHGFRNEAGQPASMLMLFTPGVPREAYFEGLAGLADKTDEERRAVLHSARQLLRLEKPLHFDRDAWRSCRVNHCRQSTAGSTPANPASVALVVDRRVIGTDQCDSRGSPSAMPGGRPKPDQLPTRSDAPIARATGQFVTVTDWCRSGREGDKVVNCHLRGRPLGARSRFHADP